MINRESIRLATLGLAAVVLIPFAFRKISLEGNVKEKTPVAIDYSQPETKLVLKESPHNYAFQSSPNKKPNIGRAAGFIPQTGNKEIMGNQDNQKGYLDQQIIEDIVMRTKEAYKSAQSDLDLASRFIERKLEESKRPYLDFKFQNELEPIRFHSYRVGVELALMLAIRTAENGGPNIQFGIVPSPRYDKDRGYSMDGEFHEYPQDKGLTKQMSNSACTVKKNWERYETLTGVDYNALSEKEKEKYMLRFINFLGCRYAPENAENDPEGLNKNWVANVAAHYLHFKQEEKKLEDSKKN